MRFLDITMSDARTLHSNEANLHELMPATDLLIGAVLVPGAKAPKLITRAMLKKMRPGSVLVDIAIDQGGCAETSRPTDASRSGLCRGRSHSLLRREYARRLRAHVDSSPNECDISLCRAAGELRIGRRLQKTTGPNGRNQYARWQTYLQSGGRRTRSEGTSPRFEMGRCELHRILLS